MNFKPTAQSQFQWKFSIGWWLATQNPKLHGCLSYQWFPVLVFIENRLISGKAVIKLCVVTPICGSELHAQWMNAVIDNETAIKERSALIDRWFQCAYLSRIDRLIIPSIITHLQSSYGPEIETAVSNKTLVMQRWTWIFALGHSGGDGSAFSMGAGLERSHVFIGCPRAFNRQWERDRGRQRPKFLSLSFYLSFLHIKLYCIHQSKYCVHGRHARRDLPLWVFSLDCISTRP